MLIKKLIEKIVNLLLRIGSGQSKSIVVEERVTDILNDHYVYFINRLKQDIKLGKIKLN